MAAFSARRNKRSFERAQKHAQRASAETGVPHMVCGYLDNEGNPQYFVVSKNMPDDEIREIVFVARHGRPMNTAEKLLDMAANGVFVQAAEKAIQSYLVREPAPAPEELLHA